MVQIAHVAVYVTDLERSREFFQTYFGAQAGERYHNPRTGLSTYFLSFETGVRLEIMHRPDQQKPRADGEVGWHHLAFSLGSPDDVDQLTARLAADGFAVLSGPRTTGDGYYESVVLDPDGNHLELTV